MKPLLRWVGGKTRLLKHLRKIIGNQPIRNYFEPCVGGGALFFDLWNAKDVNGAPLVHGTAFLNDVNIPLIQAYIAIRDNPLLVEQNLRSLLNVPYIDIKAEFNANSLGSLRRAALFLAVNHLCFNGLWRENQKKGHFNVPVGRDGKGIERSLSTFDYESIKPASMALCKATFSALPLHPWPWMEYQPGEGDLVFYDPPYLDVFADYHMSRFGDLKHRQLRAQAQGWADRGARVVVCGSTSPDSLKLYGSPHLLIELNRTVGASLRDKATEAIFLYEKR